jgi:hypothetical protein
MTDSYNHYPMPSDYEIEQTARYESMVGIYMATDNEARLAAITELVAENPAAGMIHGDIMDVAMREDLLRRWLQDPTSLAQIQGRSGEVAQRLTNYLGDGLTMADAYAIHTMLSVQTDMTDHSLRQEERPWPSGHSLYFLTQFSSLLAWRLPAEEFERVDPHQLLLGISPAIQRVAEGTGTEHRWLANKQMTLANALAVRRLWEQQLTREASLHTNNPRELRLNNDALAAELRRLQRVNLTPTLYTAGTAQWSIHDMFDIQQQLAVISANTERGVDIGVWSPMVLVAIERPETEETAGSLVVPIAEADVPPLDVSDLSRFCYMDDTGELFADPFGTIPLSMVYDRAGKRTNYEELRQFLLTRWFEASVPEAVVQRIHTPAITERSPGQPAPGGRIANVRQQQLLPYIRALRQFPDAGALDALGPPRQPDQNPDSE